MSNRYDIIHMEKKEKQRSLIDRRASDSGTRFYDDDDDRYDEIEEVHKFNPYHGYHGYFSTADTATSFTFRTRDPGKQHMADMASERENRRVAAQELDKLRAKMKSDKERIKAAKESIKTSLGGNALVDLSGVDPEVAESVAEHIKDIMDKYPECKQSITAVVAEPPLYPNFGPGTFACFTPADQVIHLNTAFYGDKAKFEKEYADGVADGFFPKGTTWESAIVHEMGHALDRYVGRNTPRGNRTTNDVSEDIDNTVIRDLFGEKPDNMSWVEFHVRNQKKLENGLSKYSTKMFQETFAEAFSEYHTSKKPRKLSKNIMDEFHEHMKKMNGGS